MLGAFGAFGGGLLCARVSARYGQQWTGYIPAMAIGISVPLLVAMLLTDNTLLAIGLFVIPGILSSVYAGPTWAIIQELVTPDRRAMAASVYMMIYNLVGLGFGPLLVGVISSLIEPSVGDQSLRYAMAGVLVTSLFGVYAYIAAGRRVTADIAKVQAAEN